MNKKVKSLLYFTGFVIAALIQYQVTHTHSADQNEWADSTLGKEISIEAIH
ncbi:hypothetical protein [Pareuzebyella sediminis]|uniref:hypothetical protein n=1 Tax=Pareuzebyella sediminis TaxID=2607998 RepID=UPI0018E12627|nr:hypothetical protein [Pareuzebyella sediminis]